MIDSSESLRADHGDEQVDKQQQRDDPNDDCFHVVLLQLLAKAHVQSAEDKKRKDGSNKDEVAHKSPDDEANLSGSVN